MSENKGSALRGLGAYQARKDEEEAKRAEAQRGKFNRFNLLKDGDEATVRFGQELDVDASGYSDKQGIGFVNIEHKNPDRANGWKNRANCSIDSQGDCYPCDLVSDRSVDWSDRKGWKQQEKFYINVIGGEPKAVEDTYNGKPRTRYLTTDVNEDTGEGEVYFLEQGTYNGIYDALAKSAIKSKKKTILDTYWTITRKGSNYNDTSYILTRGEAIPKNAKALDEFELVVIDDQLREVEYPKQEAFYWNGVSRVGEDANSSDDNSGASSASDDSAEKKKTDEW